MTRPVGIAFPNQLEGASHVLQVFPAEAESWGYDSIWITDHVVGTRSMEGVYDPHWLEAMTTLTWLAAKTKRIRIGTGIIVLPHRDPVLLAKMVATVDVLSQGRVDLGVGTGWSRVEFRALGVERLFDARGRASDECLEIMRLCWGGGPIEFAGEFYSFKHVSFEPAPAQQPALPIWVGGQSPAALRRAARFADFWHPHDISPDELVRLGATLDEQAGRAVRRSVRLDVAALDVASLPDLTDAYVEAGCERIVLEFRSLPLDETMSRAEAAAGLIFG
ncbi:MAG: putative oxidoreductase [Microbacteriaceae bacterium]|nr:putative oxidoreductase [Microbacteriaceae bacterium]